MYMDGICKERDVLVLIYFHPLVLYGVGRMVDHGGCAIHRGNETKAEW